MGCPICDGGIGYRWGSDQPCTVCEAEYNKVAKKLPRGIDIRDWGSARRVGKRALAEGKSLEEAQAAAQAELEKCLKWKRNFNADVEQRMLGDRADADPRIDQLFG